MSLRAGMSRSSTWPMYWLISSRVSVVGWAVAVKRSRNAAAMVDLVIIVKIGRLMERRKSDGELSRVYISFPWASFQQNTRQISSNSWR